MGSDHASSGVVDEGGRVLTLDEPAILEEVRRRAPAILERTKLGALIAPKWPVVG